MNSLLQLKEHGQSIWLDHIARDFIYSGELKKVVDQGDISGVSINPAIVAGEVQMVADPLTTVLPHIQSGKLRPLAITSATRSQKLPDVPTVIEAGYPKLQATFWLGVVAPAGTPPDIIQKLNAAFRESLAPAETRARLDALGAEIKIGTPAEFEKLLADELAKWTAVVKAANIKVE